MESEHFRDVGESTKLELTFRLTRIEPQALLSQPILTPCWLDFVLLG